MIVMPDDTPAALRRGARAYEALWDLPVGAHVLRWTEAAFSALLHLRTSLPATIAREGRLLYPAPLLGDATFHCQQAVEKALKAFLIWHDRPFRKNRAETTSGAGFANPIALPLPVSHATSAARPPHRRGRSCPRARPAAEREWP